MAIANALRISVQKKKVKLIVQTPSGTQALTLRGLSNPGVLRMGVVYREAGKQVYSHYPTP